LHPRLARSPRARPRRAVYALALVCGFVVFCAYLKWAPFVARYQLPLFVLGAPLAAVVEEFGWRWLRPLWIQLAICLFLLSGARLPAIENWVRPLRGPRSVLRVSRDNQYFADMTHWENRASYFAAASALEGSACRTIGIDIHNLQLEYPLQALVREARPTLSSCTPASITSRAATRPRLPPWHAPLRAWIAWATMRG